MEIIQIASIFKMVRFWVLFPYAMVRYSIHHVAKFDGRAKKKIECYSSVHRFYSKIKKIQAFWSGAMFDVEIRFPIKNKF